MDIEPETATLLLKKVDELTVQAMLFDMDIDYETLTLTEKVTSSEPRWLTNWKEMMNSSDRQPIDYQGWE